MNPLRVFHDLGSMRLPFCDRQAGLCVSKAHSCGFVKFVVLLICVRKAFVFRVPRLRCSAGYESSGCEIQRRIEKCFVGFDCFGY